MARSQGLSQFWPSLATLYLCLAGVAVPNALSIGMLAVGIGMPPRPAMILTYATLALIARLAKPAVTIALYLATVFYDTISTLAQQFNLTPREFGLALHLVDELNFSKSPLYVALIGISLALLAGNLVLLLARRDLLRRGNPLVMTILSVGTAATDFVVNTSPHHRFGSYYASGQPMESATTASGLRAAARSGEGHNVLVVMVEALGQFSDPAHLQRLRDSLRAAETGGRYVLTEGATTYYGSTTAGEMRELCDTRAPYEVLLEKSDLVCLPRWLAEAGYRTISLHNFTGRFFDRDEWYPKVGFQRSLFREDLKGVPYRICGGSFRGPCDTDLIPVVAKELRETGRPTFFYWLTLSTHVPIAPGQGTPRLSCNRDGGAVGQTEVCYMTEMWMDVLEALAKMIAELPPMEVLIVGDHAPPLWSKVGRNQFVPGKVPWFRLTPGAAARQTTERR